MRKGGGGAAQEEGLNSAGTMRMRKQMEQGEHEEAAGTLT